MAALIFKKEVIKIIKKEPLVFIKSRISAFKAAAMAKNSYNLYLPLIILLVIIAESMIDRDIILTMLGSGILCHTIFTIMLMPTSYFKYFYEMYVFAYVFGMIVIVNMMKKCDFV